VVYAVLGTPVPELRAELRDEGLVLALPAGDAGAAVLVDATARSAVVEGPSPRVAVVRAPRARSPIERLLATSLPARGEPPPPPGLALAADGVFPPAGPTWEPLVAGEVPVAGAAAPPAPVARAVIADDAGRVVLHAFDLRQLEARVVPAAGAPAAESGLPGTGWLAASDVERAVAASPVIPLRDGGAREQGRAIAPFGSAPAIGSDDEGRLTLGPVTAAAVSAIELPDSGGDAPRAAWCRTGPTTLLHATARGGDRAAIARVLGRFGCASIAWAADPPASPGVRAGEVDPAPQPWPFAAFVRVRTFPEGRPETWTASSGRQPAPAFRPALLETTHEVLGTRVTTYAFSADRFDWAIRAGTGERSHRLGGSFPEALGELRPRVVAAVGLGIGERRRPNGLTIGGSTGHRYASRGAVLFAEEGGLRLVRSSDLRGDPAGDATELPLTAEGGELTSTARDRGLLHDRADVCVLPDGTALVSLARFDSHEATAEVLLRLGCSDVASLDRGMDVRAVVVRPAGELANDTFAGTTLLALDPGHD
jgi:hypothetical protein